MVLRALFIFFELRDDFISKFKRQVDLCDTASMPDEKQNTLLTGAIYV